jgi:hypothetical protein
MVECFVVYELVYTYPTQLATSDLARKAMARATYGYSGRMQNICLRFKHQTERVF